MRILLFILIFISLDNDFFGQAVIKDVNLSKKATHLACIIPGSGHIFNNKNKPQDIHSRVWWKLPIIYGGLATSGYLTYYNINEFKLIRTERLSRENNNPANYLIQYSNDQLKYLQEDFRRYRDISIISFIGVYLLQIIDANVESHIFQFDTDDKLSFNFKTNSTGMNNEILVSEVSLKLKF